MFNGRRQEPIVKSAQQQRSNPGAGLTVLYKCISELRLDKSAIVGRIFFAATLAKVMFLPPVCHRIRRHRSFLVTRASAGQCSRSDGMLRSWAILQAIVDKILPRTVRRNAGRKRFFLYEYQSQLSHEYCQLFAEYNGWILTHKIYRCTRIVGFFLPCFILPMGGLMDTWYSFRLSYHPCHR